MFAATLGSGNGREKTNKLEQHESTPPTPPPDEVTPDKVTPDKLSPQVAPSSQRSLLSPLSSPLSVMRFLRAVEKVPPAHSTSLCTLLTVACNMCAGQESPVTADKLVEDFTFNELMMIMKSNFPADEDDLDAEFRRFVDALDE
jgi:hypothetical protein